MIEMMFKNGQCYLPADASLGAFPTPWAALTAARLLAMDDGENRTLDRDGRMHVKESNISKANICEYFGREIPKYRELGLDPNKKYRLLRDPEELKKAAATFNNLPILAAHVPVNADDHAPHLIIGTTGTDAKFKYPHLKNSTAFWAGGAVNAIHSEVMKDLSSSYHFRADMTPGKFEGEAYDGVMRDIVGNHVALVRKGRAGDDVVVGDSNPEEFTMTKAVLSRTALFAAGAVSALIAPKLAMDAAVDTSVWFMGVTPKNFTEMKPTVAGRARKALAGVKLAQDASIEDVVKLVDACEKPEGVLEGADADPESGAPMDADALKAVMMDPGAMDEEMEGKKRAFLAEKLGEDGMRAYDELCAGKPAVDADPAVKTPVVDKNMITKPAMDSAIQTAVQAERDRATAIRTAELAVEPYVGKLALAFDSAPAVYGKALEIMGIKVTKGTHPDALPAILAAQPKPGAKPAPAHLAMDAAPSADFHKRFPGAERIGAA